MPIMTKTQLIKAYNAGQLDDVYNEVRRYGVIVTDRAWDMEEPARYAGAWRSLWINHAGRGWSFTLHNGRLTEAGYKVAPVLVGIHGQAVTEEENAAHNRIAAFNPKA